jgi:glycosyltransferase involved in cell wall biosynthesis
MSKSNRVLQLIDSLDAGGAERVAVNYANALVNYVSFSGIVATRKEGALLSEINSKVSYLFLNKKKKIDFGAIFRLKKYVKENSITLIHAHSSSFLLAFLLKIIYPSIKIIWHDHYGNSDFLDTRPFLILKITAPFFNGVIAVNQNLKIWSEQKLGSKNVIYLPNFPVQQKSIVEKTHLKGIEGKRIVCLANLRPQKNHFLLLNVAQKLQKTHPDWSFHLVGKDFEDDYSEKIKNEIEILNLENNVFIYGSREDVDIILNQSTITILTSQSEGLPLSLLEYGLFKKPCVVTAVGEMPTIVKNKKNGFIVPSNQSDLFCDSLKELIENENLRTIFGTALFETIFEQYAPEKVIKQYLNWLKTL